jgi:Fe-S-cluster containining protein
MSTVQQQTENFRLPRHERRHPWLVLLLDCLALVDASVAEAISRSGRTPVCARGCALCCSQRIPVTPVELAGLSLYVQEEMRSSVRRALAERLDPDVPPGFFPCRFLLHGCCAVYPMRPIACRRYIIFGEPCSPGEEPPDDRPGDVLQPSREALQQALALTLPCYADWQETARAAEDAFSFCARKTMYLDSVSRNILSACNLEAGA